MTPPITASQRAEVRAALEHEDNVGEKWLAYLRDHGAEGTAHILANAPQWLPAYESALEEAERDRTAASQRADANEHRLQATERELERFKHGEQLLEDYVCPDSQRADVAEAKLKVVEEQNDALATDLDFQGSGFVGLEGQVARLQERVRELEALCNSTRAESDCDRADNARLRERVRELEERPNRRAYENRCEENDFFQKRIPKLEAQLAVKDEALRSVEVSLEYLRDQSVHWKAFEANEALKKVRAALATTPAPSKDKP
jgi:chromosome segregation ATPase